MRYKNTLRKSDLAVEAIILVLRRLGQEEPELGASLGYRVSHNKSLCARLPHLNSSLR